MMFLSMKILKMDILKKMKICLMMIVMNYLMMMIEKMMKVFMIVI